MNAGWKGRFDVRTHSFAIAAVIVAGACSSSPPASSTAAARPASVRPSPGSPPVQQQTVPGRHPSTTTGAGRAAKATRPNTGPGGGATATTAPGEPPHNWQDAFDQRVPVPPGSAKVAEGRDDPVGVMWRLYVNHDGDGRTCLIFFVETKTSGGGGGTCEQKPPIDRSMSTGAQSGNHLYGLVTAEAVTVRVEHTGGDVETFSAVGSPGFGVHFYGGHIVSNAPVERIVGLDAKGKIVAERTETPTTLLMSP